MNVIVTADLYTAFVRKFSIGSNNLTRFKAAFLSSYNDCLMDLYNEGRLDEPVLLTDTVHPTADNTGTALEFAPTDGEYYYKSDTDVYYEAIVTDGSSQLFLDTDYWSPVNTFNSTVEIRFLPQIKTGIHFFLQTDGEWVKGESRDQYAFLNWEKAKGIFEMVEANAADAAETSYSPWGD